MAKVLPFSRSFPAYHPKKGQPTFFVEKFWKSLNMPINNDLGLDSLKFDNVHLTPKYHTIRAGHRFKAGDYFSPRVWGNDINPKSKRSGPYHSKQIIIAPDTLIVKVYDFEIKDELIFVNGTPCLYLPLISKNDGLDKQDLLDWFQYPKTFSGQIICWADVNYPNK